MKLFLLMFILSFSASAFSASTTFTGKIQSLRVEYLYGFIEVDESLVFGTTHGCSNERVWVDVNGEIGRVAYSTALAALAGQNTVKIRVSESSSNIVYGACKLHDIVILRN